jgi:hypothetical protein
MTRIDGSHASVRIVATASELAGEKKAEFQLSAAGR